jgi:hypothetical protein
MFPFIEGIKFGIGNSLKGKTDVALTSILVVLGVAILCIALFQHNRILKAAVIAWVILP